MSDINFKKRKIHSVGYVYVICASNRLVKIGKSTNPVERIRAISNQSGLFIKNEHISCLHEGYGETEATIHEHFKKYRILGEWFDVGFDDVLKLMDSLNINPISNSRLHELENEQIRKDKKGVDAIVGASNSVRISGIVDRYGPIIKMLMDMKHIRVISNTRKMVCGAYAFGLLSGLPEKDIDPVMCLSIQRIEAGDFDYSIDYAGDEISNIINFIEGYTCQVPDPRFGQVNTYPKSVLDEVFH